MKSRRGDLLTLAETGELDVIAHGSNACHVMGAGIAKQIRQRFPEAWEADARAFREGRPLLGTISTAEVERNGHRFTVVNAYTQLRPGPCADIDAIGSAFELIAHSWPSARIGYPRIGCGIGGLRWEDVAPVIEEALQGCEHTLVELP